MKTRLTLNTDPPSKTNAPVTLSQDDNIWSPLAAWMKAMRVELEMADRARVARLERW